MFLFDYLKKITMKTIKQKLKQNPRKKNLVAASALGQKTKNRHGKIQTVHMNLF
jgi:hypothetical protein